MSILILPVEILLQISDHLNRQDDFYTLSLVCRYFHTTFDNQLYLFNTKRRQCRALFWAAENGRVSTLRRMLDMLEATTETNVNSVHPYYYYDPYTFSRRGKTCLHLALEGDSQGHLESVKLLLQYGADPERRTKDGIGPRPRTEFKRSPAAGKAPLYMALVSGNNDIINFISSSITDFREYLVDSQEMYTPLHVACRCGRWESARQFLEKGVEINAADKHGWTALQHSLASDYGFNHDAKEVAKRDFIGIFETVKVLISSGADPVMQRDGRRWLDGGPQMAANIGKRHMNPKVRALFRGESVSADENSGRIVKFSDQELSYLRGENGGKS